MRELTDIYYVRDLMKRHNAVFKKSLGQNFLVDAAILDKICAAAGLNKDIGVIEIGTGVGVLTQKLCQKAKKVVAFEIDASLFPILEETLADYDNYKIIHQDFMRADVKKVIEEEFDGMDVCVVANLPYYITTPIVSKILEDRIPVKNVTVMVQKEVGARFCAKPSTKDYGSMSVLIQYYTDPTIVCEVTPDCFVPPPKVTSSVVSMSVLDAPSVKVDKEARFFNIVHKSFEQRRKTLVNGLKNGGVCSKEQLLAILEKMGINANIRGEALTLEEFARISNEL